MRMAVINSFPNHPQSVAESEWIRRFFSACRRLRFEPIEVITSDDIIRCQPDCVLSTHEISPKLTHFPTLSLSWNPPDFIVDDPHRLKSVLSMDGYLCASRQIAQWLDDFCASHGKVAMIHEGLMLPSAPDSGPAGPLPDQLEIMYAGVHWDGARHGAVFRGLEGRVPMRIYGPREAWEQRAASYRGTLPFDGVSIIRAIREGGIALCLHKAAHRAANCPTMRLFEAAAAGALIITDDFDFPREWFGGSVLYVDAELPTHMIVEQIVAHVEWANQNREAAHRLARRSNELFLRSLTLEHMLKSIPEFVDQVRERRHMVALYNTERTQRPAVEYIMRVGSRPTATIARALDSLAAQTYPSIAVVVVQFHPVSGLDELLESFRSKFVRMRHIIVANDGCRSSAWWAGLNALQGDYFGMLDDDDTLHPNHVASIMNCLEQDDSLGFVYSGLIKVEDESGHYVSQGQFSGPTKKFIEERREIICLQAASLDRLLPTNNVIGNHAWICRRSLLDREALADPHIEWGEDVYFTALMAARAKFGFTAMPTAVWHWRSTTKDNWTLSHPLDKRNDYLMRWQLRLQNLKLPSHNIIPAPGAQYDSSNAVIVDRS